MWRGRRGNTAFFSSHFLFSAPTLLCPFCVASSAFLVLCWCTYGVLSWGWRGFFHTTAFACSALLVLYWCTIIWCNFSFVLGGRGGSCRDTPGDNRDQLNELKSLHWLNLCNFPPWFLVGFDRDTLSRDDQLSSFADQVKKKAST